MAKTNDRFLVLFLCSIAVSLAIASFGILAHAQSQMPLNQFEHLDATAASNNGDEESLRSVVAEMVHITAGNSPTIPSAVVENIIAAELAHRNGKQRRLHNADIEKAVNELASELKVPDYARTSTKQVASVRIALHMLMPHLIKLPDAEHREGMAPLEAATVTLFLLKQKLSNPDFQVTPDEWETNQKNFRASSRSHGDSQSNSYSLKVGSAGRTAELKEMLRQSKAANDPSEANALMDRSFKRLGFGSQQ